MVNPGPPPHPVRSAPPAHHSLPRTTPSLTHSKTSPIATTVETRPEWLPDEYEHIQVTSEEIRQDLDRDAKRHFGLTADEFLAIYRDPPEQYHGDPAFRSLTYLAFLIAEPSETS